MTDVDAPDRHHLRECRRINVFREHFYFATPARPDKSNGAFRISGPEPRLARTSPQSARDDCFRFDPISRGDEDDGVDAGKERERERGRAVAFARSIND